jgi:hypothetical protein
MTSPHDSDQSDAVEALGPSSNLQADAVDDEDHIREVLCTMMLSRARRSLASGSIDAAADFVTDVLSVDPDNLEAASLLRQIAQAPGSHSETREPTALDYLRRAGAMGALLLVAPLIGLVWLLRAPFGGRKKMFVSRVARASTGRLVPVGVFRIDRNGHATFWGGVLQSTGIYRLPALAGVIVNGALYRVVLTDSPRRLTAIRALANHCIVVSACAALGIVFASGWKPVALRYWLSLNETDWSPLIVLLACPVAAAVIMLATLARAWLRPNEESADDLREGELAAQRAGAVVTVFLALLFLVFTTAINAGN